MAKPFKLQVRDIPYVTRDKHRDALFKTENVKAFIVEHYAKDIARYNRVITLDGGMLQ